MISYLKWQILHLFDNNLIILTDLWIGYEVNINEYVYSKLLQSNEKYIWIYIFHQKTENSESLFGFLSVEERQIFKEIIKIWGIWGKLWIAILSIGKDYLIESIKNEDKNAIEQIKWVGKKMAEKILIELKDKDFIKNSNIWKSKEKKSDKSYIPTSQQDQIKQTLTGMWYNSRDVEQTISNLPNSMKDMRDIIPYIIKELSR